MVPILTTFHAGAEEIIKNVNHLHFGDLMNNTFHYMLNGWGELQTYCMAGQYTIDNIIAERFDVNIKNSLFYSSETGVGIAVTYLTVMETTKMNGLKVRDYLVHVFREIMNGNKDCSTYAPETFQEK